MKRIVEQAAQAAESARQAAESCANKSGTQNNLYKVVDKPTVFSPKTRDEELAAWPDWKFGLMNYLSGVVDTKYREELEYIERHSDTEIKNEELASEGTRARSEQLFVIFGTILGTRPLRVVKTLGLKGNRSGFEVFRLLVKEKRT